VEEEEEKEKEEAAEERVRAELIPQSLQLQAQVTLESLS